MPKTVSRGACQELVLEPNLDLLPIQHCWPGDPAPFVTLPAVITRDPRTGHAERRHVPDAEDRRAARPSCTGRSTRTARADWRGMGDRLDVAVALGCDPITTYSASAPLPEAHRRVHARRASSRARRSSSSRRRRSTSRCPRTPRSSSRATSRRASSAPRARSATTRATTRRAEPFPVFHLTAMTMRRDAIYPSIVVGVPPQEDAWLGKATERIFLPAIRMTVPEIVDYDLPGRGRVPQLRDRLDPQGVPRPRAQGHARDLGPRDALALEDRRRRGRVRGRARLRRGLLPRLRERRPEAGRDRSPRARSTSSTTPRRRSATAGSSASTRRTSSTAEGGRDVARADRDERRGS